MSQCRSGRNKNPPALAVGSVKFKYTRNSHKKNGRAYVCFPINVVYQNYIVVFSLQTNDLDENIELEQEIEVLKRDFINRMEYH